MYKYKWQGLILIAEGKKSEFHRDVETVKEKVKGNSKMSVTALL